MVLELIGSHIDQFDLQKTEASKLRSDKMNF